MFLKGLKFGLTVMVAWEIAEALAPKIDSAVRKAGLSGRFADFMAQDPTSGVIQMGRNAGRNWWTGKREYARGKGGKWVKVDGARARGGPVWKGGSFLVGENGPEVFTPGRSGNIIPNGRTAAMLAAAMVPTAAAAADAPSQLVAEANAAPQVTINVNGAQDPHAVAREVRREVKKLFNRSADLSD
jgi:hypothetical protein